MKVVMTILYKSQHVFSSDVMTTPPPPHTHQYFDSWLVETLGEKLMDTEDPVL